MKQFIVPFLLFGLAFSSCATYTYRESTAHYIEPVRAGFVAPVVADIRVEQNTVAYTKKFENTLRQSQLRHILLDLEANREPGVVQMWKKGAVAEALKAHHIDDLVNPTFEIQPSEDLRYIEVTVTGHPATYVNYRQATQEDVNLIAPFLEDKKTVSGESILFIRK